MHRDAESHSNMENGSGVHEKGRVLSAFLEPVFTEFDKKTFYENAEDMEFITFETFESLCNSIDAGGFGDGSFVKIIGKDGELVLSSAEEDEGPLLNKKKHGEITENIARLEGKSDGNIFQRGKITKALSYHVNVGHGNASFLVVCFDDNSIKPVIVMVDCKLNNRGSDKINFKACVDYIEDRFSMNGHDFELDMFLLTHPHFDHYSGIHFLLENGYITGNTGIWLNCRYDYPGSFYNSVLEPLASLTSSPKFINPIRTNGSRSMNIWYPENIIRRTGNASGNVQIEENPNNASVLTQFLFDIGGREAGILFTGDIETEGWNKVKCPPGLGNIQNYCISHHGSRNGHERNFCHSGQNIGKITDCPNSIRNAVLMGRGGAYPGIYHQPALNEFGTLVRKTEGTRFLEIDLLSGLCRAY